MEETYSPQEIHRLTAIASQRLLAGKKDDKVRRTNLQKDTYDEEGRRHNLANKTYPLCPTSKTSHCVKLQLTAMKSRKFKFLPFIGQKKNICQPLQKFTSQNRPQTY